MEPYLSLGVLVLVLAPETAFRLRARCWGFWGVWAQAAAAATLLAYGFVAGGWFGILVGGVVTASAVVSWVRRGRVNATLSDEPKVLRLRVLSAVLTRTPSSRLLLPR